MTTLGSIVDLLGEMPADVATVSGIVRDIRAARESDRPALGAVVASLAAVPEAIDLVAGIVNRIRDARPEDRDALLADVRRATGATKAAFEAADARLVERFVIRDAGNG